MHNLSSYHGLVDARMRASYKDLPVLWFKKIRPRLEKVFQPNCAKASQASRAGDQSNSEQVLFFFQKR